MYVKNPVLNSRPLNQKQIDQILADTRLPLKRRMSAKLKVDLIEACNSYFVLRFCQTRLTPLQTKSRLRKIERAAVNLLTALESPRDVLRALETARNNAHAHFLVQPPGEVWGALTVAATRLDPGSLQKSPVMSLLTPPPPEKDWQDFKNFVCFSSTLDGTIVGIALLAHWAKLAKNVVPEGKSSRARHQGDQAMNRLIVRLAAIYAKAFGRSVRTSFDTYSQSATGPLIRFVQACCSAMRQNISDEMRSADSELEDDLCPSADAIRARIRVLVPPVKSSLTSS